MAGGQIERELIILPQESIPFSYSDSQLKTLGQESIRYVDRRRPSPILRTLDNLNKVAQVMRDDIIPRGLLVLGETLSDSTKLKRVIEAGLADREKIRKRSEKEISRKNEASNSNPLALRTELLESAQEELQDFELTSNISNLTKIAQLTAQRSVLLPMLVADVIRGIPDEVRSVLPDISTDVLRNPIDYGDEETYFRNQAKLVRNQIVAIVFQLSSPILSVSHLKTLTKDQIDEKFSEKALTKVIEQFPVDEVYKDAQRSYIADLFYQTQRSLVTSTEKGIDIPDRDSVVYNSLHNSFFINHPALEVVIGDLWSLATSEAVGNNSIVNEDAIRLLLKQAQALGQMRRVESSHDVTRYRNGLIAWETYRTTKISEGVRRVDLDKEITELEGKRVVREKGGLPDDFEKVAEERMLVYADAKKLLADLSSKSAEVEKFRSILDISERIKKAKKYLATIRQENNGNFPDTVALPDWLLQIYRDIHTAYRHDRVVNAKASITIAQRILKTEAVFNGRDNLVGTAEWTNATGEITKNFEPLSANIDSTITALDARLHEVEAGGVQIPVPVNDMVEYAGILKRESEDNRKYHLSPENSAIHKMRAAQLEEFILSIKARREGSMEMVAPQSLYEESLLRRLKAMRYIKASYERIHNLESVASIYENSKAWRVEELERELDVALPENLETLPHSNAANQGISFTREYLPDERAAVKSKYKK